MKVDATLRVEGLERSEATSIDRALSPDNTGLPEGSSITFKESSQTLEILIRGEMELGALNRVMNDLLICLRVSQEVLGSLKGEPLHGR